MGLFGDNKLKPLSQEDRDKQVMAMNDLISRPMPKLVDLENNPHLHVYFVAIDGTGNNRDHLKSDQQATIPAVMEADLHARYERADNPLASRFESRYYSGVGTQTDNPLYNLVDQALSLTDKDILKKAYEDFQHQAKEWIAQDPQAEIYLVASGFSRGAAISRNLMNMVDRAGIPEDSSFKAFFNAPEAEKAQMPRLREPGEVHMAAVLFDTVSTLMTVKNLEIPSSADYVVHLVSDNDKRFLTFPADSILEKPGESNDPRLVEVHLPGVHTDIGNGYLDKDRGGNVLRTLGAANEEIAIETMIKLGFDELREIHPAQCKDLQLAEHDSRTIFTKIIENFPVLSAIAPDERNIGYRNNEPQTEAEKDRVRQIFEGPAMSKDPSAPPTLKELVNPENPMQSKPLSSLIDDHYKTHNMSLMSENQSKELAASIVEGFKSGALKPTDTVLFNRDPENPVSIVSAQELPKVVNQLQPGQAVPATSLVLGAQRPVNEEGLDSVKKEMALPEKCSKLDVISAASGSAILREDEKTHQVVSVPVSSPTYEKFEQAKEWDKPESAPALKEPLVAKERQAEMSRELHM